jgi:hypothetical protein
MTITELHRELGDEQVLSVYIAAEEHDPAERTSWRNRLTAGLDREEAALDGDARSEFLRARDHLTARLRPYPGFLPGRGWVAFVTAEGARLATEVPAPMPDLVRWRRGPVLGPWLRAVKQERPILITLVDSRRARLLRYHAGELSEEVDYRAHGFIDDLTDRNMSKRAAQRSGVRGETATDAADRILKQETERLLKRVAEKVRADGKDAFLILGGPATAVAALEKLLQEPTGERVLVEPSLHVTMSMPELKAATEPLASALTRRLQRTLVQDVLDLAGAADRGVLGLAGSSSAGALGQIELLLLTPRFLQEQEEDAEQLIALTLGRGGAIDVVAGEAASLLDSRAGGVAARLRFVRRPEAPALGARQS